MLSSPLRVTIDAFCCFRSLFVIFQIVFSFLRISAGVDINICSMYRYSTFFFASFYFFFCYHYYFFFVLFCFGFRVRICLMGFESAKLFYFSVLFSILPSLISYRLPGSCLRGLSRRWVGVCWGGGGGFLISFLSSSCDSAPR